MLLDFPPDIIDLIFIHIAKDAMDQSRNYINIEHHGNTQRIYDYYGTMLNGLPQGQGQMMTCVKFNQPIFAVESQKSLWLLSNLFYILKSYTPILK